MGWWSEGKEREFNVDAVNEWEGEAMEYLNYYYKEQEKSQGSLFIKVWF